MINETIEPHYTIISNKNFTFFSTLNLVRSTSPEELNELIKMIYILQKLDPNNVADKQKARKFLINSINNN